MTDAELIYGALLRAERRLEERCNATDASAVARLATLQAVILIREEIGNGLAAWQSVEAHPLVTNPVV